MAASVDRPPPRFGCAWRGAILASVLLIAYLVIICLLEGGPSRLFEYEYKQVREPGGVPDAVIIERHGTHGWTPLRGVVRSGLGIRRYTFLRPRIQKYVPFWILGIDFDDDDSDTIMGEDFELE